MKSQIAPVGFEPFEGVRYQAAGEMSQLACPPYDVISAEEQDRLYDRHPHNAIHLELAKTDYSEVAEIYKGWRAERVLERDEVPAFYVYRQDFKDADGQRRRVAGVIGALGLQEFGETSGVLPHERTMPGPKKDRLSLLRACPVNFSPLFAIYRGSGGLAPFYDSLENRPPAVRFQDDAGTLHRMWALTAPAEIEAIGSAVSTGPLVIADGHHRYETALEFHREQQGDGDHGAVMTWVVDADAEGLVVLPYNRLVSTAADPGAIAATLESRFGASTVTGDGIDDLARSSADHPLLFLFPDRSLLVELSDDDVVSKVGQRADAWRALDVVALHEVVLADSVPGDHELAFSKDEMEIRKAVSEGRATFGVLLRPLTAPQIVDVARSGERMPQKASYFWPKAVTGIVFRELL
jgi:uncharacterized protein (DUF1015 family)